MEPVRVKNNGETMQESSPSNMVPEMIKSKEEKLKRLFRCGLIWLGVGVFFMGLSFVLNLMFISTEIPVIPIMIVMTSIGGVCIMKGLVDILGF